MISRRAGPRGGGVADHREPWGITTTSLLGIECEETEAERADSESTTSRDVSWRRSMIRRCRSLGEADDRVDNGDQRPVDGIDQFQDRLPVIVAKDPVLVLENDDIAAV